MKTIANIAGVWICLDLLLVWAWARAAGHLKATPDHA